MLSSALFVGAGCTSSDQKPVYPVSGEVFFRSKPAEGARVILHPTGDSRPELWPTGYPTAVVGADGSFHVTTYEPGDGAPEGNYAVLVEWPEAAPAEADPEAQSAPKDRLGGRYLDSQKPKLKADVKAGPNQLPRFDLE
jgi:hypothetical protein